MMDKSEALKEWLMKMREYYASKNSTVDHVMCDGFKQLLGVLEREGYERAKDFMVKQMNVFKNSDRKLSGIIYQIYFQAHQKIWGIERKYGGK